MSVNFLDVTIGRVGDKLTTDIYQNPTGGRQLLRYDSYHSKHQKNITCHIADFSAYAESAPIIRTMKEMHSF